MKKILLFSLILAFLLTTGLVYAMPEFKMADVKNPQTGEIKNTISIPSKAKEVSPALFYLGETYENGKKIEGYAFIHYKKGHAMPGTQCGNKICEPGENSKKCPADCSDSIDPDTNNCYGFLTKEAKWKINEAYLVNPVNSRGVSESSIMNSLISGVNAWEDATNYDILGDGSLTYDALIADTQSPDGLNEVYFGSIDEPGAIAITIVWGIFGGAPKNRELIEWDQIYDQIDFDWSGDCENEDCSNKMDFFNIAIHELGHTVGMGDLYNSTCAEQTMYGYASEGETKKRDLEAGDIIGINKLY